MLRCHTQVLALMAKAVQYCAQKVCNMFANLFENFAPQSGGIYLCEALMICIFRLLAKQ